MLSNMKTYFPTLFMFFLLVVPSESAKNPFGTLIKTFPDNFPKKPKDELRKQVAENLLQKALDKLKNQSGPPTQPVKRVKREGLHLVKEYLYNYGYIQYSDPFTDYMDQEMVSAIKSYQTFFNLDVNGNLDNKTRQHIALPRCAVPDKNFTYDLHTSNLSWPTGTGWFRKGTKGMSNLTYGFLPASEIPPKATKVFRDSFQRWSQAITVLNLTETMFFEDADIKIGFYIFDNKTVGAEVVGGTIIRLPDTNSHAIYGDMRLDGEMYWVLPTDNLTSWSWEDGEIDLETVVMHQIGHLLGLDHSTEEDAVMYPSILASNKRKTQLSNDDAVQIQRVYYSGGGSHVTLGGSTWKLLNILSLGFAAMLLFD